MQEIWKDVIGYEGLYQVGDLGNVRRLNKPTPMLLQKRGKGYLGIMLYRGGVGKMYLVHRIVATSFLGESDLQVDHKNGNKKDNRLTNLEYVDNRENVTRGFARTPTTSAFTGVSWHKRKSLWQSRITINKKVFCLGYFTSQEEAHERYLSKLKTI